MTGERGRELTQAQLRLLGAWREREPMSRHTSWRVGGPADRFYQPRHLDDLAAFLAALPEDEPLFWMGLGSNLLVRDGGIRGTVVCTSGMLNGIEMLGDGRVRVEAGVSCAKTARFCTRAGLRGAEFLVGIPGTMGGALAMNAGAFGGETWPLVVRVETLDRHGGRHVREAHEYEVGYREVRGVANEWFVAAELRMREGGADEGMELIKRFLHKRTQTQPTGIASGGSVFRNPPGDYAGRLIEACGLKGFRIGGASVSRQHANFIVNDGQASAADIESLIEYVRAVVERETGVGLIPEVHIVGEHKRSEDHE